MSNISSVGREVGAATRNLGTCGSECRASTGGGCSGVFVGLWNQQRILFVKPSALVGPRFGELVALVVFLVTTVFPTKFPLEVAGVGVVVVVARGFPTDFPGAGLLQPTSRFLCFVFPRRQLGVITVLCLVTWL